MSERIYAWLLKLYPVSFRQDYGTAAMQLFRDRLRAERGVFRRLRFWADIITDLAISLAREHLRHGASDPVMGGHRLSEEALAAMTKRTAIIPAILVGVFIALGLTLGWLGNSGQGYLSAAYIPLALLVIGRFRSAARFQRDWRSYRLVLDADRLQMQKSGNDVTVRGSEIIKVNEDQYGLIVVGLRGHCPDSIAGPIDYRQVRERLFSVWIPKGLTGYSEVRERVLQWTGNFSQRRSSWLKTGPLFECAVCLLPALVLVRSAPWFLTLVVLYYSMVLLAITMHVARPPRDSGLVRRRGLNLPPPAYLWRRMKHTMRSPLLLVLLFLPIVRTIVPH